MMDSNDSYDDDDEIEIIADSERRDAIRPLADSFSSDDEEPPALFMRPASPPLPPPRPASPPMPPPRPALPMTPTRFMALVQGYQSDFVHKQLIKKAAIAAEYITPTAWTPENDRRPWPLQHRIGNNAYYGLISDQLLSEMRTYMDRFIPTLSGPTTHRFIDYLAQYGIKTNATTLLNVRKISSRHYLYSELLERLINISRGLGNMSGIIRVIHPLKDPFVFSSGESQYIVKDLYSCELRDDILSIKTHDTTLGFITEQDLSIRLQITPKRILALEINHDKNGKTLTRYNMFPFEISSLWDLLLRTNPMRNAPGSINSSHVSLGYEKSNVPVCDSILRNSCILKMSYDMDAPARELFRNAANLEPLSLRYFTKTDTQSIYRHQFSDLLSTEVININLVKTRKRMYLCLYPRGFPTPNDSSYRVFANESIMIMVETFNEYLVPVDMIIDELTCPQNILTQYCGNDIPADKFIMEFGRFSYMRKKYGVPHRDPLRRFNR